MEIPFMKHKKKENIFVPSHGFYIYMSELLSLTQTLYSLLKSSQPQAQKEHIASAKCKIWQHNNFNLLNIFKFY